MDRTCYGAPVLPNLGYVLSNMLSSKKKWVASGMIDTINLGKTGPRWSRAAKQDEQVKLEPKFRWNLLNGVLYCQSSGCLNETTLDFCRICQLHGDTKPPLHTLGKWAYRTDCVIFRHLKLYGLLALPSARLIGQPSFLPSAHLRIRSSDGSFLSSSY